MAKSSIHRIDIKLNAHDEKTIHFHFGGGYCLPWPKGRGYKEGYARTRIWPGDASENSPPIPRFRPDESASTLRLRPEVSASILRLRPEVSAPTSRLRPFGTGASTPSLCSIDSFESPIGFGPGGSSFGFSVTQYVPSEIRTLLYDQIVNVQMRIRTRTLIDQGTLKGNHNKMTNCQWTVHPLSENGPQHIYPRQDCGIPLTSILMRWKRWCSSTQEQRRIESTAFILISVF